MSISTWNGLYNINWRSGKLEGGFYSVSYAIDGVKDEYPLAIAIEDTERKITYLYASEASWNACEPAIAQVTRMDQSPIW